MPWEPTEEIEGNLDRLRRRLLALQNQDGGFKGFHVHDVASGVWTTAEAVHILCKTFGVPNEPWLEEAVAYLTAHQNADGGWPFRPRGKSITDISAWVCLALGHSGCTEAVRRGIEFILASRNNENGPDEEAWGLTRFEVDRVYSTWIASYCLHRLLRVTPEVPGFPVVEMRTALAEARLWLLRVRNEDGSWAATRAGAPSHTSTAVALLALFTQGDDPSDFRSSYRYLRSGMKNGLGSRRAKSWSRRRVTN